MSDILFSDFALLEARKSALKETAEELPVVYATNDSSCIFSDILFFTNNRNEAENKTLKNMKEAINSLKGETKPKLHVFVASKLKYDYDGETLNISDGKESMDIVNQSKYDTLVISRLGVLKSKTAKTVIRMLEDRGLLVLNPVNPSKTACDKYETYQLLEDIVPQPRSILMSKNILDNKEDYIKKMQKVYKNFSGKGDKDKDYEFVVKILDGHGGTGVSLVNGKEILSILQTMFAIDKNRLILIQNKEDADGGDIRVHVLTLKDKQIILAAMKRVKLDSDFRSNVSLGASATKVKLTPEQEQIALKAAKASKLPWCAVDIMPLKENINKPDRNNVVLELNSSPGTDGISSVIGENFINVLLSSLYDPDSFMIKSKELGYKESGEICFKNGIEPIPLTIKMDTGNGSKTPHIEVGDYHIDGTKIYFEIQGKEYSFDKVGSTKSIVGNEEIFRPNIMIDSLKIGDRMIKDVIVSIVKKRDKSTNMLLNRETIKRFNYVINPNERFICTKKMKKKDFILNNDTARKEDKNKDKKKSEEE